jgi:hypothetical protein
LPGHDDHDLARRLREERAEASEESTPPEASEESTPPEASEESTPPETSEESTPPETSEESTAAEAQWILKVGLALALVAGIAAFSGVGNVSTALRRDVLGALQQARASSAAAIRSAVGNSVSGLGAVASKVGAAPTALGGDVLNALQQASDSSTAAIRSAVGESTGKQFQNGSPAAFRKQYHSKVSICLQSGNALVYVTRNVSARSVPSLVSNGAIYPVPAGGC